MRRLLTFTIVICLLFPLLSEAKSLKALNEFLDRFDNYSYYVSLGTNYLNSGNYEWANKYYKMAEKYALGGETKSLIMMLRASIMANIKNYEEAESLLEEITKMDCPRLIKDAAKDLKERLKLLKQIDELLNKE